jgi:outer membrane protein assembly factor BamB
VHLSYDWSWAGEQPFFTVGGDVVYYSSASGEVFALDSATGQLLWEFQTLSGRPAAPTVSDDVVLLGSLGGVLYSMAAEKPGGLLYALDAATGQLIWHYPTDAELISFPLVADGLVYVTTTDGHVYAVRPPV